MSPVGILGSPRFRGARFVAADAGQAIANDAADATILWTPLPAYDTDGFCRADDTGFTIPAHLPGMYRLSCGVGLYLALGVSVLGHVLIRIVDGGTLAVSDFHHETAMVGALPQSSAACIADSFAFDGGESVDVRVGQKSGAGRQIANLNSETYFALQYLGRKPA